MQFVIRLDPNIRERIYKYFLFGRHPETIFHISYRWPDRYGKVHSKRCKWSCKLDHSPSNFGGGAYLHIYMKPDTAAGPRLALMYTYRQIYNLFVSFPAHPDPFARHILINH